MISPSVTISRVSFGISRPIVDLPGMISTTRTLIGGQARARSLARFEIWLTLTPGAGRSSKRVMTGPGCTSTTSASTPKSRSFSSTRRDMASSASAEYPPWRGGASSSSDSGGSAVEPGFSNSGTCRSFSTRSLFSTLGATGSIFGGLRSATFFCSSRTTSARACLTSRPALTSRAVESRSRSRTTPSSTPCPMRSITASHDTPVKSETDPSHTASSSRSRRGSSSPTRGSRRASSPARRQRCSGYSPGEKCSVARPQLLASASRKPSPRNASERRSVVSRPVAPLEQRPAGDGEQHREQERGRAEQHEEQVRHPGAERPDQVCDRVPAGRSKKTRGPRGRSSREPRSRISAKAPKSQNAPSRSPRAHAGRQGAHLSALCFSSRHQISPRV